MIFRDRSDAGQRLACQLRELSAHDTIVLALPRGGVAVGCEVAEMLRVPLDIVVVRKLGVPSQKELAMGAISTDGVRILNRRVVEELGISAEEIERVTSREMRELERQEHEYRGNRESVQVNGSTSIVVDDGVATGAVMHAAVAALRLKRPKRVVIAVPVAASSMCEGLQKIAEKVVCLYAPVNFQSVGQYYDDFSQVTDEQVRKFLEQAWHRVS